MKFLNLPHKYFALFSETVLNNSGISNKPDNIFNCDETGINSQVSYRQKAYGRKGERLYQQKVSFIRKKHCKKYKPKNVVTNYYQSLLIN